MITKPTYVQAHDAYQTLLELRRAHPDDRAALDVAVCHAWELLKALHREEQQLLQNLL